MIKKLFSILLITWPFQGAADCNFLSKNELKNYNYIIVPGIFNEIIPFYMTEYRRYLLNSGVPKEQILRVNSTTRETFEKGALKIKDKILALDKKKAVIFFAHSKGALETLYFLIENNIKLKKAFLIQGALDGSSLYKTIILGERRGFLFGLARVIGSLPYVRMYLESFNFNHVREKLKGVVKQKNLLNKIVFIQSEEESINLSFKFKFLGNFYKKIYGRPGDGVLLLSDQIPFAVKDESNICRFFYKADHGDLVTAAPWQKQRINKIKLFLNEILLGSKRD